MLRVPVDAPYVAGGRTVDANWHVLARITTSDGIEGIGYVVYPRPDLMTVIGQAARELGEHLIGMSVLEPEATWERLARRGDWVGPEGLLHCALAPLTSRCGTPPASRCRVDARAIVAGKHTSPPSLAASRARALGGSCRAFASISRTKSAMARRCRGSVSC